MKSEMNITMAYMIAAAVSCLILLGYCVFIKKKHPVFLLLFTSVSAINLGYVLLARSQEISEALLANGITYAGAVFLPLFILLIILDECDLNVRKGFLSILLCINTAVLLLVLSPGKSTLYYEDVSLAFQNGGTVLQKVYGPLHGLYLIFLLFYFTLMFAAILVASRRKPVTSPRLAICLLIAVLINLTVWFIEQKIDLNYEFLSISYIVTELYLLSLYNMKDMFAAVQAGPPDHTDALPSQQIPAELPSMDRIMAAWPEARQLTHREREVFQKLIQNEKRKDIAEEFCVSENTIKKHTSNIFDKLEVSSRAEIIEHIQKISG